MTILTDRAAATAHVETRPTFGSGRRDPEMAQALQRFYDAHTAAEEARVNLTRAQAAGVDALPPGVEFLFEAANAAWQELLTLAGEERGWVHDVAESRLGKTTMRGYVGRRRRHEHAKPMFDGWEESIGKTDWSRGRGAA